MEEKINSYETLARVAGFAILITMAIVVFANFGISERLIIAGNDAETARNIMAHELLFRIGIACDLIYAAGIVVLLTLLYVILKPLSQGLAIIAAFFRLFYALIWVVMALNQLSVLRLLDGADYLRIFEADRLQALARLYLGANFDAYYIGLPFYGLASSLCSYLWFRSNYIPRALATYGAIASIWCTTCAFTFIIFPNFDKIVNAWLFDSPMALFELALSFWLLVKGVKVSRMRSTN